MSTARLSALDATCLELEQADPSAHMHIGAVLVLEPRHGGGAPSPEAVTEVLAQRLDALPRYRERLSHPDVGGVAILSLDGRVVLCINCDRDAVPDADVAARGILDDLTALGVVAAAVRSSDPPPTRRPARSPS